MNLKLKYIFILPVLALCFGSQPIFASAGNKSTPTELVNNQNSQYQQLKSNTNNFFGSTNQLFSIPNFLYGNPLLRPKDINSSFQQTIDTLFKTYPDLFQTTIDDFKVQIEKPNGRDITQVHLSQQYKGVPVFGAETIDIN